MFDNKENLSDEKLVLLSIQDSDNFYYLAKRYEVKLLRYISRLVDTKHIDIEDILQEAFIKTYCNLNAYDDSFKFNAWIYRITRNQVLDYYRKQKKHFDNISLDDNDLKDLLKSSLNIKEETESKETQEKVKKLLGGIEPKYQEVLLLRYLEGLDYVEIADILGKPTGTISTLISRAKTAFKQIAIDNNLHIL